MQAIRTSREVLAGPRQRSGSRRNSNSGNRNQARENSGSNRLLRGRMDELDSMLNILNSSEVPGDREQAR